MLTARAALFADACRRLCRDCCSRRAQARGDRAGRALERDASCASHRESSRPKDGFLGRLHDLQSPVQPSPPGETSAGQVCRPAREALEASSATRAPRTGSSRICDLSRAAAQGAAPRASTRTECSRRARACGRRRPGRGDAAQSFGIAAPRPSPLLERRGARALGGFHRTVCCRRRDGARGLRAHPRCARSRGAGGCLRAAALTGHHPERARAMAASYDAQLAKRSSDGAAAIIARCAAGV